MTSETTATQTLLNIWELMQGMGYSRSLKDCLKQALPFQSQLATVLCSSPQSSYQEVESPSVSSETLSIFIYTSYGRKSIDNDQKWSLMELYKDIVYN